MDERVDVGSPQHVGDVDSALRPLDARVLVGIAPCSRALRCDALSLALVAAEVRYYSQQRWSGGACFSIKKT